MKPLILALLLIPLTVPAQQPDIIRQYDRFENRTRYWTPTAHVMPELALNVSFSYKGTGAGHQIEGFMLIFTSSASEWQYIKNSRLRVLIDGKSIDLGNAAAMDHDIKPIGSSVQVKEVLAFRIKYKTLEHISKAALVEMRLGSTEFQLKSYVQSDIEALMAKVQIVK